MEKKPLIFEYKNWKGEVGIRHVFPEKVWYGSTSYHTEEQWIMTAFDCDKKNKRDFAMKDIIKFI